MTTTVPIPLTSEEQAALQAAAKVQGVSVENLLHRAVLQIIATPPPTKSHEDMSPEEFHRALQEIADMVPKNIPPIPLEALSRESIYTREDEC